MQLDRRTIQDLQSHPVEVLGNSYGKLSIPGFPSVKDDWDFVVENIKLDKTIKLQLSNDDIRIDNFRLPFAFEALGYAIT